MQTTDLSFWKGAKRYPLNKYTNLYPLHNEIGFPYANYLFTGFSGHRPAQRECARTGLRSHARCHPYPTPQPVKVGHTTGAYDPYSFRIVMWVLLRPTRTNQWKCCETGPTGFRPNPRRLESLTICRCHFKGSFLPSQLFKDPECWSGNSYLKTLSVGPAGFWNRRSPNWANQAAAAVNPLDRDLSSW